MDNKCQIDTVMKGVHITNVFEMKELHLFNWFASHQYKTKPISDFRLVEVKTKDSKSEN